MSDEKLDLSGILADMLVWVVGFILVMLVLFAAYLLYDTLVTGGCRFGACNS